jgi:hypothetical protein
VPTHTGGNTSQNTTTLKPTQFYRFLTPRETKERTKENHPNYISGVVAIAQTYRMSVEGWSCRDQSGLVCRLLSLHVSCSRKPPEIRDFTIHICHFRKEKSYAGYQDVVLPCGSFIRVGAMRRFFFSPPRVTPSSFSLSLASLLIPLTLLVVLRGV